MAPQTAAPGQGVQAGEETGSLGFQWARGGQSAEHGGQVKCWQGLEGMGQAAPYPASLLPRPSEFDLTPAQARPAPCSSTPEAVRTGASGLLRGDRSAGTEDERGGPCLPPCWRLGAALIREPLSRRDVLAYLGPPGGVSAPVAFPPNHPVRSATTVASSPVTAPLASRFRCRKLPHSPTPLPGGDGDISWPLHLPPGPTTHPSPGMLDQPLLSLPWRLWQEVSWKPKA